MVGIVDYGMGNLLSVYNAFDYLGVNVMVCSNPSDLNKVNRIVIPGVGAFKDCINRIKSYGFADALHEEVIIKEKPTMGICLGMQIMASKSFEGGDFEGLGWFEAEVIKLTPSDSNLRVPNIGWNTINYNEDCPLFKGLPKNPDFYLVHSYYVKAKEEKDIIATYDYTFPVTASILKNNIFATQFHPEKSQDYGLKMLDNFIEWKP